jgi:hypothetical protein
MRNHYFLPTTPPAHRVPRREQQQSRYALPRRCAPPLSMSGTRATAQRCDAAVVVINNAAARRS